MTNLADYIKAELAAGREVRVHADKWLAHHTEGWVCKAVGTVMLQVQGPEWAYPGGGTCDCFYPIPIADCTLVQPPLQVGDRVQTVGTESLATIVGIDDSKGRYWIRYADDDSYNTLRSSDLERLP